MNTYHELMDSGEYTDSSGSEYSDGSESTSFRGYPVVDSTSYTIPGNPMAHLYENRLTPFSQIEPLAPITRQRSLVQQELQAERSRRATPVRMEIDGYIPEKRIRDKKVASYFTLPDIVPNDSRRSEDILDGLSRDGLVDDSSLIRHTRSGIAYNYMYGPPARKPRRLPRIVSEGAVRRGQERYLVDALDGRAKTPRKQLNPKCYCSGGLFTDDIRCAVNSNRQKRELKNSERVRNQLKQQNDRVSMVTRGQGSSTTLKERADMVHDVIVKQDRLRQKEARRAMENFMKQNKRK